MFAILEGCIDGQDWRVLHPGKPKDVGIRVRRIGRDPEYFIRHRERTRETMRALRANRREASP